MSHFKRAVGLVVLVAVVVVVMAIFSSLPESEMSLTGKVIGINEVSSQLDNNYALASSLAISGPLPDSMRLRELLELSPYLNLNEQVKQETIMMLSNQGFLQATVGDLTRNSDMLGQVEAILGVSAQRVLTLQKEEYKQEEVYVSTSDVVIDNSFSEEQRLEIERQRVLEELRMQEEEYRIRVYEEQLLAARQEAILEQERIEYERLRFEEEQRRIAEEAALKQYYTYAESGQTDYVQDVAFAKVLSTRIEEAVSIETTVEDLIGEGISGVEPQTKISDLNANQREELLEVVKSKREISNSDTLSDENSKGYGDSRGILSTVLSCEECEEKYEKEIKECEQKYFVNEDKPRAYQNCIIKAGVDRRECLRKCGQANAVSSGSSSNEGTQVFTEVFDEEKNELLVFEDIGEGVMVLRDSKTIERPTRMNVVSNFLNQLLFSIKGAFVRDDNANEVLEGNFGNGDTYYDLTGGAKYCGQSSYPQCSGICMTGGTQCVPKRVVNPTFEPNSNECVCFNPALLRSASPKVLEAWDKWKRGEPVGGDDEKPSTPVTPSTPAQPKDDEPSEEPEGGVCTGPDCEVPQPSESGESPTTDGEPQEPFDPNNPFPFEEPEGGVCTGPDCEVPQPSESGGTTTEGSKPNSPSPSGSGGETPLTGGSIPCYEAEGGKCEVGSCAKSNLLLSAEERQSNPYMCLPNAAGTWKGKTQDCLCQRSVTSSSPSSPSGPTSGGTNNKYTCGNEPSGAKCEASSCAALGVGYSCQALNKGGCGCFPTTSTPIPNPDIGGDPEVEGRPLNENPTTGGSSGGSGGTSGPSSPTSPETGSSGQKCHYEIVVVSPTYNCPSCNVVKGGLNSGGVTYSTASKGDSIPNGQGNSYSLTCGNPVIYLISKNLPPPTCPDYKICKQQIYDNLLVGGGYSADLATVNNLINNMNSGRPPSYVQRA